LISGSVSDASGKSPAQQSSLRRGDIIREVNQSQVAGNGALAGVPQALAARGRTGECAARLLTAEYQREEDPIGGKIRQV
jgi:hypothetical protein